MYGLLHSATTGDDWLSGQTVAKLHEGGATICIVTHDPRYARHAQCAIHLFDRRIVEQPLEMVAS